ncbi:MAG: hypothetical protein J6V93_00360 [Clostridia bacterium]|nr:hypothetical protein [Clostridia bacterium]
MEIILIVVMVIIITIILSDLILNNIGNTSKPQNDKTIAYKENNDLCSKTTTNNKTYNTDEILRLKNKDFAFKCLYILEEKNKKQDVEKLTNPIFCKNYFDMNFAILQEITSPLADNKIFKDNSGYRRYYPDIITLFDRQYIVCNDWYYNNKSTTRDTRTSFLKWVLR